jgi:hypothetical protein
MEKRPWVRVCAVGGVKVIDARTRRQRMTHEQ